MGACCGKQSSNRGKTRLEEGTSSPEEDLLLRNTLNSAANRASRRSQRRSSSSRKNTSRGTIVVSSAHCTPTSTLDSNRNANELEFEFVPSDIGCYSNPPSSTNTLDSRSMLFKTGEGSNTDVYNMSYRNLVVLSSNESISPSASPSLNPRPGMKSHHTKLKEGHALLAKVTSHDPRPKLPHPGGQSHVDVTRRPSKAASTAKGNSVSRRFGPQQNFMQELEGLLHLKQLKTTAAVGSGDPLLPSTLKSDQVSMNQEYCEPKDIIQRQRSNSWSSEEKPKIAQTCSDQPSTMPRSPHKSSFKGLLPKSGSLKSSNRASPSQAHPQSQHEPNLPRTSPLPHDFPNAGNNDNSRSNPISVNNQTDLTSFANSPPKNGSRSGPSDPSSLAREKRKVYVAESEWQRAGDLNVAKYEKLELLAKADDVMWFMKSRVTGSKGLVPKNILILDEDLDSKDWFHGSITRDEAEDRLMKAGKHGTFLIRYSVTNQNDYALSLLDGDIVKHYRIREHDTGGYFIGRQSSTFTTVEDLVQHYSQTRELCSRLAVPCNKVPVRALPEDPAWELDRNFLKMGDELGKGQFGVVHVGTLCVPDPTNPNELIEKQVAVKELKTGKSNSTDFKAEVTALKKLRHERLLRLVGVCTLGEPMLMVTEFMRNGSLLEYLKAPHGKRLRKEELLHIALQVAEGMQYLEEQNYVHRDLAARNVLLDDRLNVKIADFGLSKIVTSNDCSTNENLPLPVKWSALESLIDNCFTSKSDVWSFGVLFFEILTHGFTPYRDMNNFEVMEYVKSGKRMKQESCIDDRCYNIMLECWSKLPENRPTFYQLREKITDYIKEVKMSIRDHAFDKSFIEK